MTRSDHRPISKRVGERLRGMRLIAGYRSAEAFAEALHTAGAPWVQRGTVQEIESGNRWVSLDEAFAIAKVLGVSVERLCSHDVFVGYPVSDDRKYMRPTGDVAGALHRMTDRLIQEEHARQRAQ